jgi:hypothetical membrane protein
MKFKALLIPGILVILFYCIFTFISIALFPPPFSPIDNYLSDLGNSTYSPNGAIFYNVGCILTGSALFPFFIGLFKWYRKEIWHKILIIATQIIGCYSGFALIMIGVFSEDFLAEHIYWSNVFFFLNLMVLILASIFLSLNPKFIKVIGLYGIIVAIINLLFVFVIGTPILEWFTVFTALGFVALILYNTSKILD